MLRRFFAMFFLFAAVLTGCALDSQGLRCGRRANPPASPTPSAAPNVQAERGPAPTTGALRIGPENSTIRFVGASLINKQPGSFGRFDGQMELASDDLRDARLSVQIVMDSVETKIPLLTKHLKRADFLDVEHFPTATFVSSRIEPASGEGVTHTITGEMTIHGVTRTLTMPARFNVTADLVALDVTIPIRQSEFGMEKAAKKTDDLVPVAISARLPRR